MNLENVAKTIITHSLKLKENDNLAIYVRGSSQKPLQKAVEDYAKACNINVRVLFESVEDYAKLWNGNNSNAIEERIEQESELYTWADGILLLRCEPKVKVSLEKNPLYAKYQKIVHTELRLRKKWCLCELPNKDSSILAGVPLEEYLNIFISACSLDYDKMRADMKPLIEKMEKSSHVHILANNTDLKFDITDMPVIACTGECNLPDGEVYTAPIKNSVNGYITYNVKSTKNGVTFENIHLEFKDGKIVEAYCDGKENAKLLNEILDSDEGARYIGEFAVGFNDKITKPLNNILFDEKIMGSIHFTPGACYEDCDNGNRSSVHWDLVLDLRQGGKLIFRS